MSSPISLIEFPADDMERATKFWTALLEVSLDDRGPSEGEGLQTHTGGTELGVHARGRGPGDNVSLPYFTVADLPAALARIPELGGQVIHPGERWAVCRDSEGSPFGLTTAAP
jgi:predicted enzyme related to lactoylglutathione lyase